MILAAYQQAIKSYNEGGLPIGAVMVKDGKIIAKGHNRRIQDNDPTAHGEMDCIRNAGRRSDYSDIFLYTTLSPCMMCAGTIVQFGIPRVIIGENKNFSGNIEFLLDHSVTVQLLHNNLCFALMAKFIKENPKIWLEDIAA